jgi:hypothetical protein
MKIDLTKDHSLLCGITADGARYKQKGRRFKADGNLVNPDDAPKEVDYGKMPVGKAKSLMEELDEPWTNKAEAVEVLKESGYSE